MEIRGMSLYPIKCTVHAEMYPTLSKFLKYLQSSKLLVLDCNSVHHSQNPLALDSASILGTYNNLWLPVLIPLRLFPNSKQLLYVHSWHHLPRSSCPLWIL